MAKDEEKLRAKEAKARAKALKAEAKAKKKLAKAEAKKAEASRPAVVVIPPGEKKPWWKKFIHEHLVQIVVKVIAGLIVAYLVWRLGFKK